MLKTSASQLSFPMLWTLVLVALAAGALTRTNGHDTPSRERGQTQAQAPTVQAARLTVNTGTLPLAFEENQGQVDEAVKYVARSAGYTVFLAQDETVFALSSGMHGSEASGIRGRGRATKSAPEKTSAIHMRLLGANTAAEVHAGDELPGKTNYYMGSDPAKWKTSVPQYGEVLYGNVYPGVDLRFHGQQRQLEFDFRLAPEANASVIGMSFQGAQKVTRDADGNLVVTSASGNVSLHKPVAYQERNGQRDVVEVAFRMESNQQVRFALGPYDHSRELVIDPSVTFATYLGGSAEDDAYGVGFDSFGNVYVTGQTASSSFPGTSGSSGGGFDAFVTKISPDGTTLIYSTYLGGGGTDSGNAIAVDYLGNAYVAGGTDSTNFPATSGAFQKTAGGDLDAFVCKFASTGTMTYCTYLGGSGADYANGIAVDSSGAAYVVGSAGSNDFPLQSALQGSLLGTSNGFVAKVNAAGSALGYSTYLGGDTDFASAVAVDSSGNAYVTGGTSFPTFPVTSSAFQKTCGTDGNCNGAVYDGFVTVFNGSGQLVYSTFLGGEGIDEGLAIAVDSSGQAYVTGLTQSTLFPHSNSFGGVQDAFVTELNAAGSGTVRSFFLGGSLTDAGSGIAVDENGNVYVTGETASTNFPNTGATQASLKGGTDAFLTKIGSSGSSPVFSTYLGGTADENHNVSGGNLSPVGSIAVEKAGANVYLAGNTASSDFPKVSAKQSTYGGSVDAFLASFGDSTVNDFSISASTPATVSAGSSGTSTVTVTQVNGYASSVTLSCVVTGSGSPLPTCGSGAFSPASVTPTNTSTLTIKTSGAAASLQRQSNLWYALWLPVLGLTLIGGRFSARGTGRKKLLGVLLLSTVMALLFFLPACGGSSNSGGGGGGGCPGCTPSGNYTVTISGTDDGGLVHSTQITLTVH